MSKTYTWQKRPYRGQSYEIVEGEKTRLEMKRKHLLSSVCTGKAGKHNLACRTDGLFDRVFKLKDENSGESLGDLSFRWVDFQKSTLKLPDGTEYSWRSHELLKGCWAWYATDQADPLMVFRVDTPFHRSGSIEFTSARIPALQRDLLLFLGLQLQIYLNLWIILLVLILLGIIT